MNSRFVRNLSNVFVTQDDSRLESLPSSMKRVSPRGWPVLSDHCFWIVSGLLAIRRFVDTCAFVGTNWTGELITSAPTIGEIELGRKCAGHAHVDLLKRPA